MTSWKSWTSRTMAGGALSMARRRLMQLAAGGVLAAVPSLRGGARADDAAPSTATAPNETFWTSGPGVRSVFGYVDRHSVLPGERPEVMLSTMPGMPPQRGQMLWSRLGARGWVDVWTSPPVTVDAQRTPVSTAVSGANWLPCPVSLPTANWRSGVYRMDFLGERGERTQDVAFLVVRHPAKRLDVVFKLPVNTYQAYNAFGGIGLYPVGETRLEPGTMVSFDRPLWPYFQEYDVHLATFLETICEQHGFSLGYATDFDLHDDPAQMMAARVLAFGGHDEYWTKEMYDAVEDRIHRRGGNVIFYGANTAYWQARYADVNAAPGQRGWGRQLVCAKNTDDPVARRVKAQDADLLVTKTFRWKARRPETMLAGVAYQDWFRAYEPGHRVPFHVATVDGPFFEGTGWRVGDRAADVVGYEWDNRDPAGDGNRLWQAGTSRNKAIPPSDIQLLMQGEVVGIDHGAGRAETVLYRSKAGAKVFSSGSIRWAWGLGKPGFSEPAFIRFNQNVLLDFLKV